MNTEADGLMKGVGGGGGSSNARHEQGLALNSSTSIYTPPHSHAPPLHTHIHVANQPNMSTQTQVEDNTSLYRQLDAYDWAGDEEFQGGLQAILGSVQDLQQVEHLTLRAKCYYYARKSGQQVDFDGYKYWVEARQHGGTIGNGAMFENHDVPVQITQSSADGGMGEAPKPASFAEICDMIAEGKPIPGIKDIPDTILEGQASAANAERRKKPWEKNVDDAAAEKPSWMT